MSRLISQCSLVWRFLEREVKTIVIASILLGLLTAVVDLLFAYVLQFFLQGLGFLTPTVPFFPTFGLSVEFISLILLVIAGSAKGLCQGYKVYLSRLASQSFAKTKRKQILARALDAGPAVSMGQVVSLFSDEVNRASMALLNLNFFVIGAATSFILAIILAFQSWFLILAGVSALIILLLPVHFFLKIRHAEGHSVSSQWLKTNETLINGIKNNFYLNICGLIEQEQLRASETLERYQQVFMGYVAQTSYRLGLPAAIGTAVIAFLAFLNKEFDFLSSAIFVSFLFLFVRFVQSSAEVYSVLSELKLNFPSLEILVRWFEVPRQSLKVITKGPQDGVILENLESLEIREIAYRYNQNSKLLFSKISANVKQGKALVITGPSGVGKSTLMSLAAGFLRPSEGQILYNQISIEKLGVDVYHHFGYVGPVPYIIEGTLKENLLFGHFAAHTVKDTEMEEALALVDLNEFALKENWTSLRVDEQGDNLSSGQLQRISMARAFLRKPQILLLDEATSNLDFATEQTIMKALKAISPNCIMLIVSHRKALLEIATEKIELR